MKLTQKWVNDSCDNYDQNSDKNESWCSQATTTTAHTHTDTHSHPQKKSERNNIKSKKKLFEKKQIQPDVRQHTDNKKSKNEKNKKKIVEWRIIK